MPREAAELKDYLDQVIEMTRGGSMEWARSNPTTFVWDTQQPSPARLSLQRLETKESSIVGGKLRVDRKTHYVFQAFEVAGANYRQKVSLSGAENADLNETLQRLFETIEASLAQKSLEFLRSILPPQ